MMPETGTFLSRDSVESEPPYLYVRGNPVNLADSSGMCAEVGDEACWGVYEQIVFLCPECAYMERDLADGRTIKLHEDYIQHLQIVLENLQAGWRPWPLPEAYRRTEIMNYATKMAGLVESGDITDLEALVRITEFAAKLYDESSKVEVHAFVHDIGLVLVGHAGFLAPLEVEGPFKQPESEYTVRDFNGTGFTYLFKDESNQLRHFWFAVVVEMCYPSELNKLQGILHETPLLSGTPAGRSLSDVVLSFEGSGLGIELENGTVRLTETGEWIQGHLGY